MASFQPQFSRCSNSSDVNLLEINLIFGVIGAVCCFFSTLIVVGLLYHKAYSTMLQRMFLYLMLAIVLREFFIAASLEHQVQYKKDLQQRVCRIIGFLWNWTGILVFVFTVGMKIYLFFLVKHIAKGNPIPKCLQTNCQRVVMESAFVILTVVITLAYAGIPFITGDYGLAGAWCWIRALNESCNVTTSGLVNQLTNGYIFYVSGSVIGLVLLIAISVVYCRLPITHSENRSLVKKTFCVIITFLVNVFVMVFALAIRVTAANQQVYAHQGLWLTFAITFPSSLLLFPVTYLICFTLKLNKCASYFKHGSGKNTQRPSVLNTTVHNSSRVSAPSATYYNSEPPYTDSFTSVGETAALCESHEL